MAFRDLKKNSKAEFERLKNELEKQNSPTYADDDTRYWYPAVDKAGNGYAVIRFLPAPDGEDIPYVRLWTHSFKGPGGWYIENSLTTLGKDDPCSDYNSKLWDSGIEANKEIARKQKRGLNYISNVYVIKDPANPENEGKVFLFKYGKQIFDKVNELMNPQFEDEQSVNPFNLWEGANFKLKIRKVEGYRNYAKSEFEAPAALDKDDDVLEKIYNQCHSLAEEVAPSKFKTYEELQKKLEKVLNGGQAARGADREDLKEEAAPQAREARRREEPEEDYQVPSGELDSDLSRFERMANGDI